MIDFMANIKNKKSMKKYNVKTLAEIAVLCIFCDNIQVWSMNSSDVINPNPKDNSPIPINKKKMNKNLFDSMDLNIQYPQKIVVNSMKIENTPSVYMLNSSHLVGKNISLNEGEYSEKKNNIFHSLKDKNDDRISLGGGNSSHNKLSFRSLRKISSKKINKNKENKLELLFFNKEGNLSLCCCINFFNGNMENPGFRKKKRKREIIRGRFSSECSENSQNAKSSQKNESNDNNNSVSRPAIYNNIIIQNVNPNLNYENNNGKNFTNGNPDSGNPQKIINDDTSNPFKDE